VTISRRARRAAGGGHGPSPELVAVGLVVVVYASLLLIGTPDLRLDLGGGGPVASAEPSSSPAAATPTPNPLRPRIVALQQLNQRLLVAREELQVLLDGPRLRGSEVVPVLRGVNGLVTQGIPRASELSLDPAGAAVGAQLEILYAEAGVTTARALDLALGSDYREPAQRIVDLFTDLPDIDLALQALLEAPPSTGPSATPAVSASPGASPGSSPLSSAAPSAVPSASLAPPPDASLLPPRTPAPDEILDDGGFESGLTAWALVLASPEDRATASSDASLTAAPGSSLRVDITSAGASPVAIRVIQGGIPIESGRRYVASVTVRSTGDRQVRVRVVGRNQETYGVALVGVGPTASIVTLRFTSLRTEEAATFSIDVAGPSTGTVWLDDASLAPAGPG
jgi:hypothetical protein